MMPMEVLTEPIVQEYDPFDDCFILIHKWNELIVGGFSTQYLKLRDCSLSGDPEESTVILTTPYMDYATAERIRQALWNKSGVSVHGPFKWIFKDKAVCINGYLTLNDASPEGAYDPFCDTPGGEA